LRASDPRVLLARAFRSHPPPAAGSFNVLAAGKAAQPMLDAFLAEYGPRSRDVVVARGGHPLPNAESFAAGEAALRLADTNRARGELLVVLLSGGASAMMAAPAPGVTLEEKIAVTRELLRSGLPIAEMNARRKALSAIKGGKLALRAGRSITYAISDVHAPVEDDPAVIGSGPTVLTGAGGQELGHRVGSEGRRERGVEATFVLAGSRRDAMAGAGAEADRLGYEVRLIGAPTLGEARDAAVRFAASVGADAPAALGSRVTLISSGETTVSLPPHNAGRGGRNQEFALAAALAMGKIEGEWALASIGTDGVDGPTDAAGAVVDSSTLLRAAAAGLDPRAALAEHDSYPFFERLSDLVVTGPTGTNVGDLQVFLRSFRLQAEAQ
jgi:glycerate 2-kinase